MKKQPKRRGPEFYRYLARLTAPIALQNLITFSLGLIDTFMVSQLGNLEMAAVTTANVPVFLLISIVFGIQSGVGILISQYWGKRDKESISRAIGVAAFIGTGISLLLALILFAWPVQIMDLLIELRRDLGLSYLFITHDLTSITYLCDRVVFIDAGTLVEQVDDIRCIAMIRNDYARNLLGSVMGIGVEHGSGAARTGQDRYAAIA